MATTFNEKFLDPWREFDRLNRLIEGASGRTDDFPAFNVWVNGEDAVVTTEIPGVAKEAIDISIAGNTLTLRGKRPEDEDVGKGACHRCELWHGDFSKSIKLPFQIDAEKVKAEYSRGVLKLSLPKHEAEKPRKISIK